MKLSQWTSGLIISFWVSLFTPHMLYAYLCRSKESAIKKLKCLDCFDFWKKKFKLKLSSQNNRITRSKFNSKVKLQHEWKHHKLFDDTFEWINKICFEMKRMLKQLDVQKKFQITLQTSSFCQVLSRIQSLKMLRPTFISSIKTL